MSHIKRPMKMLSAVHMLYTNRQTDTERRKIVIFVTRISDIPKSTSGQKKRQVGVRLFGHPSNSNLATLSSSWSIPLQRKIKVKILRKHFRWQVLTIEKLMTNYVQF